MATEYETDDLRDTIDAAFEQHATDETPEAKPAEVEPAAPAEREPAEGDKATDEGTPQRDPKGRFAAKPEGQQTAPASARTGLQQPAQGAAPELKAPASWTPQAREKWANVDPDIRAEVHRREGELQNILQRSASQRQFVDAFENVVRPFELFIRQENSNPLQAVQNLMQTAATLRVGTGEQKAQIVANIIKQYGVSVEQLDDLMVGNVPVQGKQAASMYDPRVDQMLAAQAQQAQQQQAAQAQSIHTELNTFAAKHEFYGDVQGMMADILEVAARQGRVLDLEQAYKQACQLHEGVSTILQQRATAAAATRSGPSPAVLRAKRAAASVRTESSPNGGASVPRDDSVRASIEAAIEAHSS